MKLSGKSMIKCSYLKRCYLKLRWMEYYYELISKEFIEEIFNENDKKYISITDRGRKYIHEYKVIIDFIEEFEL